MKLKLLAVPLLGLALGIPATGFASSPAAATTPAPSPAASASSTLGDRLQTLEDEMDRIFRESVKALHLNSSQGQSEFGSSIDIREKPDAYEARIYVPKSDAGSVSVTMKNGALNITAGSKTTGRYEENVQLPGPVQADKMKVEDKDGFVLVTIPKNTTTSPAAAAAPAQAAAPQTAAEWDQGIVRDMERMQDRMDQVMQDSFPNMPKTTLFANGQLLDSTVKLDNEKNQYVARFYLPGTNVGNVKVNVDNNNQLQVSASSESKQETTGAGGTGSQYASSRYQEQITLPGPVHADRMKVDRKEGVVIVTLPKA